MKPNPAFLLCNLLLLAASIVTCTLVLRRAHQIDENRTNEFRLAQKLSHQASTEEKDHWFERGVHWGLLYKIANPNADDWSEIVAGARKLQYAFDNEKSDTPLPETAEVEAADRP